MEDIKKDNIPHLSLKSKTQIYFGNEFSRKISDLRIFIYGLKGVSIFIK